MKARVTVTLKPRRPRSRKGRAIHNALDGLGFAGVEGVRQGKLIELDLADGTTSESDVEAMCQALLANPVIEKYRIELA